MDKEKKQNPNQEPKTKTETQSPVSSMWKRYASKKWFFPAIYLGAAVLILALIVVYQGRGADDFSIPKDDLLPELVNGTDPFGDPSVPVTGQQNFIWPVAKEVNASIVMGFYDDQATEEEQAATLVQMGKDFFPNTGIDLSIDGNTSFDVMAVADGEVVRADFDQAVGYVVEIRHANNTTVYQSLQEMNVAVGDLVLQGDVIGKAGRNVLDKDLGVHLHFEVLDDTATAINPLTVLPTQN